MLTQEQQQALEALMVQVQRATVPIQPTTGYTPEISPDVSNIPSIVPEEPGGLEGPEGIEALLKFFGSSSPAWQGKVRAMLDRKMALQTAFLDWSERNPMDAAFVTLGAMSLAFYQAERGANPKINSYTDAYYYISTCASVGYADIFAVTQIGKAIAALVMTLGPALAAKALDRPT
jgi:Ion channel